MNYAKRKAIMPDKSMNDFVIITDEIAYENDKRLTKMQANLDETIALLNHAKVARKPKNLKDVGNRVRPADETRYDEMPFIDVCYNGAFYLKHIANELRNQRQINRDLIDAINKLTDTLTKQNELKK